MKTSYICSCLGSIQLYLVYIMFTSTYYHTSVNNQHVFLYAICSEVSFRILISTNRKPRYEILTND